MRSLIALAGVLCLVGCKTAVAHVSCSGPSDCAAGAHCVEGVCVACAAVESNCFDGVDDDCNGLTDCEDPACAGLLCRPAVGPCDLAEFCDGKSLACPPDLYLGSDAICREATACGLTARCDGTSPGCPASAPANAGAKCRDAGGPCALEASCDGVSSDCPPNALRPASFACREPTADEICLSRSFCDGASPECHPSLIVDSSKPCRAGSELCEADAFCDGTSATCPLNKPKDAGTSCGELAGDCDLPDTCDGASIYCPDTVQHAGTSCAASSGPCEVGAICDGVSPQCPATVLLGPSVVCNASVGDCDLAERCDGVHAACPPDQKAPSGTMCRAAAGVCDKPAVCDGSNDACPPNGKLGSETVCGSPAKGACEVVATCDGTDVDCPANTFLPLHTACAGAPPDLCESGGQCDGVTANCPGKSTKKAGAVCRAAVGSCDIPETCNGSSPSCPSDQLYPKGTACNTVGCMSPSVCDGSSPTCPGSTLLPSGTLCAASTGACQLNAYCNGSPTCPTPPILGAGTPCAPHLPDQACAGPQCDGSSVSCDLSGNRPYPKSTRCGLTTGEVCDGSATDCPLSDPLLTGSGSSWGWDNPRPQGNTIYGIAGPKLKANTWFVGETGAVLGFTASGAAGQFHMQLPLAPAMPILHAVAVDAISGVAWAVGDNGSVLSAPTGSWSAVGVNSLSGMQLLGVAVFGSDVLVSTASGSILHGNSGGSTPWILELTGDSAINALWGASLGEVWAVGDSGTILQREANGGWTPAACSNSLGTIDLTSIWGGASQVFFTSSDTSAPLWQLDTASGKCQPAGGVSGAGLNAVWAVSDAEAWAVGANQTVLHLVAGKWTPVAIDFRTPTPPTLHAVWGSSAYDLWIAGQDGAIAHVQITSDGTHVYTGRSVTDLDLRGVAVGTPNGASPDVFAVGAGKTVLHRTTRWTPMNFGTQDGTVFNAVAIDPRSPVTIMAVGQDALDVTGVVATCVPGTDACSEQTSSVDTSEPWNGVAINLQSITFAGATSGVESTRDATTGDPGTTTDLCLGTLNAAWAEPGGTDQNVWLVGENGLICTPGVTLATSGASLYAISGATSSVGTVNTVNLMAVGAGVVLSSNSGGTSFNALPIGTSANLYGVWMKSASSYVIVGEGGYCTTEATAATGAWAGTGRDLRAVSGNADPTNGYVWAVGDHGVILRSPPPP